MKDRPEAIHLWDVQGSTPANGSRPHWSNVRVYVVARGADRAMELVRTKHPDVHFHQIIRRNTATNHEELIVDPTLYTPTPDEVNEATS